MSVELAPAGTPGGWGRQLLIRRNLRTGELAFYRCAGPATLPLAALARVAGCRWRVEEAFQATKGLCGLDEHQVRCWRAWYRWVTLAMLAYAFLVVVERTERDQHPPPPGVIALSCSEIAHLFAALVGRNRTGRNADPTRPAAMLPGSTIRTGGVSLLIGIPIATLDGPSRHNRGSLVLQP